MFILLDGLDEYDPLELQEIISVVCSLTASPARVFCTSRLHLDLRIQFPPHVTVEITADDGKYISKSLENTSFNMRLRNKILIKLVSGAHGM